MDLFRSAPMWHTAGVSTSPPLSGTRVLALTSEDFRRIALSLPADFRVKNRIFATLASEKQGFGNLKLSPEQQAALVGERPDIFLPIPGGWGRMSMTSIRLAEADEDTLRGALLAAWKLRTEKNRKAQRKR